MLQELIIILYKRILESWAIWEKTTAGYSCFDFVHLFLTFMLLRANKVNMNLPKIIKSKIFIYLHYIFLSKSLDKLSEYAAQGFLNLCFDTCKDLIEAFS